MAMDAVRTNELLQYRSIAENAMYHNNGLMSQTAFVLFLIQQKIPTLTVADLIGANTLVEELGRHTPRLLYRYVADIT